MNSIFSIIFKNLILFILLSVSLVFIFTQSIGFKEIKYILLGVGIIYILASCFEAYSISKITSTAHKIPYFTYGFLAKRFIKVISFICIGVILYASKSMIKYLAFTCFLIAVTEVIVIIYRYIKGLSYIAFDGEMLIISTNKLELMRADSIQKIDSRHGLTYFIDNTNKAFTVRTDIIKNTDLFNQYKDQWILENNISDKVVIN